ncbi:MAG: DUF5110 domain-containing protein [Pedobacter sp.]|nr:MAG: DUF5110 domain-containing protein [Pedobacter sp.]
MNKFYFCAIALCLVFHYGFAQQYEKTNEGIRATINKTVTEIQFYTSEVVRIKKSPLGKPFIKTSLSVIKAPEVIHLTQKEKQGKLFLSSKNLTVTLDLKSGQVSFNKKDGKTLLLEKKSGATFAPFNDAGNNAFSVGQSFLLERDEPIYGLGILQNGKMSQRNQKIRMVQNNTWDFVPFFQSPKGYGIFWDNYSPTDFEDSQLGTSFSSEVADGIDYYLICGENADQIIAGMRSLTGQAPMFPLWSYGYWQSKERYKSQKELVDVVKMYRKLKIPLDGIIQDWQYWGNNYLWNAMDFLNPEFSQPQQMVDDIHALNAHLMISIWSSFGPATRPYHKLDSIGALFDFKTWPESGLETWPPNLNYPSGVRVYDAYNPKARDIYWEYLNKGLRSKNIDGWWMDSTEPDHLSFKAADMDTKTFLGSFRKVRNAYPLMTVGGVYEHQRLASSDKRSIILTRSAFAGQQRFGANTWTGDIASSWESLRYQIPAGLNFSLCAIPYWNSDIGGFFAGVYNKDRDYPSGAKNPFFQELYVRWLQFGAMTPMMRSHGTDIPREIYQFGKQGEPVYDAIEQAIHLRYALLPYIYSVAGKVTNQQSTFMRALVMDYPGDKRTQDMGNEYMFGPSILVAPVIHAQYTPEIPIKTNEKNGWDKNLPPEAKSSDSVNFHEIKFTKIYLPKGSQWYDFWTNQRYTGGQDIIKKTGLSTIPLYIKAGSILPIGPKVQYATEKRWDNLELRIYPGANGNFTLYEDENDNYNYEKGSYSNITFLWDDHRQALTIQPRDGVFPGMLTSRNFSIRKISFGRNGPTIGTGVEKKVISYIGEQVIIKL